MKLNDNEIKFLAILMKKSREKYNYTLEQMRLKLLTLGIAVARSDIQRIEEGERKIPNPILISGLCKIYELDAVEIFKKIGYILTNNEKIIEVAEEPIKYEIPKPNEYLLDLSKLSKIDAESIKNIYNALKK